MFTQYEEMSFNAWPALNTTIIDGCIIRTSSGYTKRANSINPLYNNRSKISEIRSKCESIMKLQNVPLVYKIIDHESYKNLDMELENNGFVKIDETDVMNIIINYAKIGDADNRVKIENCYTKEWIDSYIICNNVGVHGETARLMLDKIIGEKYVASIKIEQKIIACGYGAIENDYVGFFDIVVDKNHRGNGFGRVIMNALIHEARSNGIKNGYLQVVSNNLIAKKLYESIGFKSIYKYWYRKQLATVSI